MLFFVKDTWTKEFLVLSSPRDEKTPRAECLQALQAAGLGKKKVVFKDKNGNFDHLKSTLEEHFPKLKSQNGAFELLRVDRGGSSHPLINIHMSSTGYTIKQLKEVVPGSTAIYVRPIQSDLDMTVVQNEDGEKAYTQCVNCHESVLLVGIKEHADFCNGANSSSATDSYTETKTQTETSNSTGTLQG